MSDVEPVLIRVELHDGTKSVAPAAKSRLAAVLGSPVLTALLTAGIGGLAAQWIVQEYQQTQKENELTLLAERQRITAQRQTIEMANDLIAEAYYHAESLHTVNSPDLMPPDDSSLSKEDLDTLKKQRQQIVDERNAFMRHWLGRKQRVATRLGYDFPDNDAILTAWRQWAAAVDKMHVVALREYRRASLVEFTHDEDALSPSKVVAATAEQTFVTAVEQMRSTPRAKE